MIPTALAVGLILGRWWYVALPVATILWGALLVAGGVTGIDADLAAGMVLAWINATVGVLIHQLLLALIRWARNRLAREP